MLAYSCKKVSFAILMRTNAKLHWHYMCYTITQGNASSNWIVNGYWFTTPGEIKTVFLWRLGWDFWAFFKKQEKVCRCFVAMVKIKHIIHKFSKLYLYYPRISSDWHDEGKGVNDGGFFITELATTNSSKSKYKTNAQNLHTRIFRFLSQYINKMSKITKIYAEIQTWCHQQYAKSLFLLNCSEMCVYQILKDSLGCGYCSLKHQ